MKTPAPPPDFHELVSSLAQTDRFGPVTQQAFLPGAAASGPYLPWDKLRYKTPPEDLTSEEWWLAVKLGRNAVQRNLPQLTDAEGRPFTYTLPDAVMIAVEEINRDASGHIAISEQVTNPSTRDRYVVNSLIEEAITSSQLEGASTTRQVAKELIRSGRPARDRSEQMILNNYLAMRRITELRSEALTPELVREIHRMVTEGTLDDPGGAGRIQTEAEERVSVRDEVDRLLHRPPPAADLQERMRCLCDFANGEGTGSYLPAVLRAITVHFMVGYDHYFEDGNGRTARALFYWSMLRQGYWLTEFLTISGILKQAPSQYARSFLLSEQDDGDLTYFFIHHLTVINRAIRDLHAYLGRKAQAIRHVQRVLNAMPGQFNHRQLALLEHAVRAPGSLYTVQSHSMSHHTSGETARQDLAALERLGLLTRRKLGRRFAWGPVEDLAERLTRRQRG